MLNTIALMALALALVAKSIALVKISQESGQNLRRAAGFLRSQLIAFCIGIVAYFMEYPAVTIGAIAIQIIMIAIWLTWPTATT
jgi:hypothetical protein